MTRPSREQRDGIEATNQDFRRYDQVDKRQEYVLSEADAGEAFDEEFEVRTCDLSRWLRGDAGDRARFARELGEALESIGFAILVGHGVDPELYRRAAADTVELFETIPRDERLRYRAERHGSVNQGYFPIEETSRIHPDQVEGWVFCRRAFDLDGDDRFDELQYWPRAGWEARFRPMVERHESLFVPIMQAVLTHLGCDPHLYDERLRGTNFGFRLNYYPPLAPHGEQPGGRMLGHEDVDLFTLLPAPEIEGLQILNRRNMKWIRLDAPAGSIVLNTGDYMQRITNDRLPSTPHRVSRPRAAAAAAVPRVSFPTAVYLWEREMLRVLPGLGPPKYPPIEAIRFHTRTTSKYYGDDYAVD